MTTLWFDLDDMEDEDLYDNDEYWEKILPDYDIEGEIIEDEEDIFCKECGALVEDGFQCPICGLVVER